MSMLDGDAHLGHTLFAHLTQNHRHTSLEDVKREFYPFLLHKVQRLAGLDQIGAQHLLQVIFEHSDVSEVLLMRCFDQALQQHIAEARSCMSASYHDLRAKSEAGSARIQTPSCPLSAWAATYRSVTRNPRDPEDIRNWTWERFRDELYDSTMYSPPDSKKLLDAFDKVKCQEPGTQDQVTAYTNLYMQAFQDLRRHRLETAL